MRWWRLGSGRALTILVVSTGVNGTRLQKVADGSVYKLRHYCTQSAQSHKPWKVGEASGMSFAFSWQRYQNTTEFGFFWPFFNTAWLFIENFIWLPCSELGATHSERTFRNSTPSPHCTILAWSHFLMKDFPDKSLWRCCTRVPALHCR